ncbi:DapH/DapD/GlmU-related protein [Staphylococcus saprophyticus]|nr:DapH/DapD/GlmU-related protein [Staphylococcus saprophyticus]
MIRLFMKSKFFRIINTPLLLFYKKEFLTGYYYDSKVMGWLWAWKAIPFKLLGINSKLPWPADISVRIHNPKNIIFDRDDIHIFQSPGTYFNNFSAKIYIGKGSYIAPNVGIITANHDINNLSTHIEGKDVRIGKNCWIGMNSVVLPGVILGDNTIIGAGSIVTKSFSKGNIVIAGNPAKIVKQLV